MDIRDNDKLRDLLAAEYAVGTLRGGARRRFETWARDDADLRARALAWSERLSPLVDAIDPVVPRPRVWSALAANLPGPARRVPARSTGRWFDRLGLWRGLTAAFAVVAVFAVGISSRPPPSKAPEIIETWPGALATVTDPKTGKMVAVVMESGRKDGYVVKVAADVDVPEGKALQLWVVQKGVEEMSSMGVLPAASRAIPIAVKPGDAAVIERATAFGLSLEPAGGSPKPTQVLGLGVLIPLAG